MAKRQSRLSINSDTQTITFFFFTSSFENTQIRRYKNNLFSKICPMVFYHTKNKIQRHIPLCDLAPGYCLPSVTSHYISQSLYSRLAAFLLVLEHTRHIQGTGCSLPRMFFPCLSSFRTMFKYYFFRENFMTTAYNVARSVIALYPPFFFF